MNASVIALDHFIEDFALRHADGVVYFYANIQFLVNHHMQLLNSDVHIVTSDGLASVYLLGLDTRTWEIPDMFTAKKDVFTYVINEYLRIEGTGEAGKYIVSISPKREEIF
jgi:hypothetical protein